MSVTGSIRKTGGEQIVVFNDFLDSHIPARYLFKSNLGEKTFDSNYPLLVPKNKYSDSSGVLGSLSELYIDVVVGRYIETNCDVAFEISRNIVSEIAGKPIITTQYKDSVDRIITCMGVIKDYVSGIDISEDIVIDALYTIYKHGPGPFGPLKIKAGRNDEEEYYHIFEEKLSQDSADEIKNIGKLFLDSFTRANILKKDSIVVVNPRFGDWSAMVGAEGDIFIDGIIYDIKSRGKEGYHKDEIKQIYGYYICSLLENSYTASMFGHRISNKQSNMEGKSVKGIGIYLSRFGEIITCDLMESASSLDTKELQTLADQLVSDKRERLFLSKDDVSYSDKLRFKNIQLDYDIYHKKTLYEYLKYAFPTKINTSYFIDDKEPVMWKGDKIPSVVYKKQLFFFVHFKASFMIKPGNKPFVNAWPNFMFKSTQNMETSDYYDKTGEYYRFYRDSHGNTIESMVQITMSKEDFEYFNEIYDVRNLIILDGCYFV